MSGPETLVRMANDIARNLRSDEATADHIRKFWDPRMRRLIRDHAARGGAGLSDIARAAVARLG